MKLLYTTIFLLASFTAAAQIKFEVRTADKADVQFDSILIIGTGPVITRVFTETVSNYIIKAFVKKRAVVSFYYAGNDTINSDTIKKQHYKTILSLLPVTTAYGESLNAIKTNNITTSAGTLTTARMANNFHYSQDFSFRLFKPFENMKTIWSASVKVDANLHKKKSVKKLAKKILKSFKSCNYIN